MTTQQIDKKYLLLSVIWTVIALIVLFAPKESVGVKETLLIPGLDKVAHFTLFAIWSFLVAKAFRERQKSIDFLAFSGVFAVIALLTEVIQSRIGRSFEWLDILADVLGVIIGLLIFRRF